MMLNPRFPLYIVSKGRYDSRLTSKSLDAMKTPYKLVIEEQEYSKYLSAVGDKRKLLVLDKSYQLKYETCDALGDSKSKGPGAARNFAWDHSISEGHDWHWVMDDNIWGFYRLNQNRKLPVASGVIFRCMEDFVLRYKNIGMAGPNYFMFAPRKTKQTPFIINTRIYSCNLIRNNLSFRWRGRYNEDTDLSLRILKARICTVQFNAFLQNKIVTQAIKGGNTAEFYSKEGTLPKSKMLVKLHPDCARLSFKFGRWHHYVDYSIFKNMPLIRKKDLKISDNANEYGLILRKARAEDRITKG